MSTGMREVFDLIAVAARSSASVLLVGESGTGKELAAQAIHRLSDSAVERFVPINCAALPAELVESELFGHRRGSFSGAGDDKEGLFQAADNGTLFLDEITELPVSAQAKLLRPLQEGRVRRVGDTREREVCVRVVASTNLPLDEVRDGGCLRRDLFYRLHGFVIHLPPLRERLGDLPLLVEHFLARGRSRGASRRTFDLAAMARLQAHRWPGNVRELQAVVERATLVCPGPVIGVEHLPADFASAMPVTPEGRAWTDAEVPLSLRDAERKSIARAMEVAAGNKSMAARMLGISRKQLYVKLDRYDLGSG